MDLPVFETLALSLDSRIAHVELNRPDKANAMSAAMWRELETCFRWCSQEPTVRVVVLSGRGKHFCAGIDLQIFASLDDAGLEPGRRAERRRDTILGLQDNLTAIERCRKPVLAAIHNTCIGGGVDMVCCADIRYGSADATTPGLVEHLWADVLARRVGADGLVDYRGLARDDLAALDGYLARVAEARAPAARADALAFYADAYNALVIRGVIRAGFPRSVLDVKGFFDKATHAVAGRGLTLDALEKEVIRPLGNPLHHFILVCGAVGCPSLEPRALVGSDVEARAEAAARRYLATAHGARRAAPSLQLSRIFEWYAADFGGPAGVRAWVRPRLPAALAAELGPDTPLS
jgi:enoyl-CoA hydratase/carnithine racemase